MPVRSAVVLLLASLVAVPAQARGQQPPEAPMNVESVTPILFVEAIEPCLPFWTEGLGFRVADRVPEGDRLGFVILQRDGMQVMLQTGASVAADIPALEEPVMRGPTTLFLRVESVEGAAGALAEHGAGVLVPRRRTFYGADEIFFESPGGHIVGLAAFDEEG